jgi:hypothetical protein
VSRGRASSPWSTLPAGKPRRRSPVSSMRCPPIRFRRPGSGCPAVRCPVTWGRRPESPAVGRLRPPVQRPAVRCPPVRCPAVWCLPVRPDASVSSHAQAVALGTRSSWPSDRDHRTGGGPGGCRAVDGSTTVAEAGTRATLPTSGWPVGGRWRTRAAGWVRAGAAALAPLSDQAGQAGDRSAPRGRLRCGRGSRLQREVAPAAWLPSSAGCATTVRGRRRA